MTQIISSLQKLVWGPPLLCLLAGVGLYLTWILRGIQFRYLLYSLKLAIQSFRESPDKNEKGELTHFQALMTSLASAIGTGNIAGVATAISVGGLGSLFWMWVFTFLGMAIKYSEALLAVKHRVVNADGEMSGGPMQYLEKGFNSKGVATLFAILGVFAAIGTGNMVQVHSVAQAAQILLHTAPWQTGLFLSFVTGLVLLGGIRSIGKVSEYFVPFMALFYLASSTVILCLHATELPSLLVLIVKSAFTGQAAVGGFAGSSLALALQMGFARGVFSSEAGLGISSIASAAAKTDYAAHQALIAMTGVFLSTGIVCTMTGLVIGVSGALGTMDPQTGLALSCTSMAIYAFRELPGGATIVSIGLILFAYTTILGWAYYGEKCMEFVCGVRAKYAYRVLYTIILFPGSMLELESVWAFADVANGLMAVPNLIAIVLLTKDIREESSKFFRTIK